MEDLWMSRVPRNPWILLEILQTLPQYLWTSVEGKRQLVVFLHFGHGFYVQCCCDWKASNCTTQKKAMLSMSSVRMSN